MITKPSSGDLRQLLRIAAPPLLTLGVLLVVGEVSPLGAWTTTLEISRRVATVLAAPWLVLAISVAAHKTKRDARAHQRLQQLRAAAQETGRALVYVQTEVWSSGAGQHVVVVNIATGHRYGLWLPEVQLQKGAFALVEQRDLGVAVIGWAAQRTVDAAHRHEHRHPSPRNRSVQMRASVDGPDDRDDARRLIEETEQFLKQQ